MHGLRTGMTSFYVHNVPARPSVMDQGSPASEDLRTERSPYDVAKGAFHAAIDARHGRYTQSIFSDLIFLVSTSALSPPTPHSLFQIVLYPHSFSTQIHTGLTAVNNDQPEAPDTTTFGDNR